MAVTLVLSVILMAALFVLLWAAVALVQDPRLFTTAPKDIQAAVTKHPERFPGARALGWVVLVLCVGVFAGAFVYGGWDGVGSGYGLWQFFGRFLTMLYLLKAFDIIGFDWFLLTKAHFFQRYYPETAGCAGYHQFGYNRKEQLIQIIVFPFLSALLAWVCILF